MWLSVCCSSFRQDSENETLSVSCTVSQLNLVVSQTFLLSAVALCCKEYTSKYRKWLRKRYYENYNNDTSNEDKRETNYSMNNDTRNMHII